MTVEYCRHGRENMLEGGGRGGKKGGRAFHYTHMYSGKR